MQGVHRSVRRRARMRGFTLLEAVVAAGLIAAVGLAVTASVVTSARASRQAAIVTEAARLAEEAAGRARAFGCGPATDPVPPAAADEEDRRCAVDSEHLTAADTAAPDDDPVRRCDGEAVPAERYVRRSVTVRNRSDDSVRLRVDGVGVLSQASAWIGQNPAEPLCITATGLVASAGQLVTVYLYDGTVETALASRPVTADGTVSFIVARGFTDQAATQLTYRIRSADGQSVLATCVVPAVGAPSC